MMDTIGVLVSPVFGLLLSIIIIWLAIVSYFLFKAIANYNRLTQGVTDKTLSEVLNNFLKENLKTEEEQKKIRIELKKIREESQIFIQKIGLVRFNSFTDTGGDQSFALALLDGAENGIVITSLYSRTGSRWYVKTIKHGKALEYDLSKEEQQALKKVLTKKET